jgi:phage/conjugal plasmid C-4 type zinc finger TraR family protein
MEGKTIAQLRDLLLTRWRQYGKAAERDRRRENESAEMSTPPAEIIDVAQSLEQLGRDTSLAEQERRELLAIERALAKMATGSFGVCEECGEEIPTKRLLVLPEARLCAHCQAFEEKQSSRMRTFRVVGE